MGGGAAAGLDGASSHALAAGSGQQVQQNPAYGGGGGMELCVDILKLQDMTELFKKKIIPLEYSFSISSFLFMDQYFKFSNFFFIFFILVPHGLLAHVNVKTCFFFFFLSARL